MLLIGHLDTVFEPDSPFQRWTRTGDYGEGPGAGDDKGGMAVMIAALPESPKPTEIMDVLAIQRGARDPNRVIIISGHIDSINSNARSANGCRLLMGYY